MKPLNRIKKRFNRVMNFFVINDPRPAIASKKMRFEEIEERILYSADDPISAAVGAGQGFIETPNAVVRLRQPVAAVDTSQSPTIKKNMVVVIDSRVNDQAHLLSDFRAANSNFEIAVVTIGETDDAFAKIAAHIETNQLQFSSIAIFSHGQDGGLLLGNQLVDSANLNSYQTSLERIQQYSTLGADLLLYGCDVAATDEGKNFVNQLALLSGLEVAASVDATGTSAVNKALNWNLEYQRGEVIVAQIQTTADVGALNVFVVDSNADSGAGSLRQAILDANAKTGTHKIEFNLLADQTVITPLTALPVITSAVSIDGATQPAFSGSPIVTLSGEKLTNGVGLLFDGVVATALGQVQVSNLAIVNFADGGILIRLSDFVEVLGNYIGLTSDGSSVAGNGNGISIVNSGNGAVSNNVITGNLNNGIDISGANSQLISVQNNKIGMDAAGTAAIGNGQNGISLSNSVLSLNIANNVIAGNGASGILAMSDAGSRLRFSQNSIFQNSGLGIDLARTGNVGDGANANDLLDVDLGANNLQNSVVIQRVSLNVGLPQANLTFNGWANSVFTIDLYSSDSVSGEAKTFLQSLSVSTNGSGNWSNTIAVPTLGNGKFLTAIVTNSFGSSSEISNGLKYPSPPSIVGPTASTFTENSVPVLIASTAQIFAPSSQSIFRVEIEIAQNYRLGDDQLNFAATAGISGTFNSATGKLTLLATDTILGAAIADFQTVLRSVSYVNNSDAPITLNRQINYEVFDGSLIGTLQQTLAVVATNDAPVGSLLGTSSGYSEQSSTTQLFDLSVLSDIDSSNLTGLELRVSATSLDSNDRLVFVDQNGITGSFDNLTKILTLSGSASVATYQSALRSIQYVNSADNPVASKTFDLRVNDGSNWSGTSSRVIAISAVNDPPTITGNRTITYPSLGNYTLTSANLGVADLDGTSTAGYIFTVTASPLTTRIVLSSNLMALTGITSFTAAQLNAGEVVLVRTANTLANDVFSVRVSDGTNNSAIEAVTINYLSSTSVVTVGYGASPIAFVENGSATSVFGVPTITNSGTQVNNIQVRVQGGFQTGTDRLSYTVGGITTQVTNGIISLSGNQTNAGLIAVLSSITFDSTSDNPSLTPRQIVLTLSTAAGVVHTTVRTVAVTSVNDSATVIPSGVSSYTEQGAGIAAFLTSTITDLDHATLSGLQVRITSATLQNADQLVYNYANGIVGQWNQATGTLTLSGEASVANYQAALRSILFSSTSDAPTDSKIFEVRVADALGYGVWASSNLAITAVNDAPEITGTFTATVAEGASIILTTAMLNAVDVDLPSNSSLVFTISQLPVRGRLELNSTALVVNSTFTYADLIAGRVRYVHLGDEQAFDQFKFRLGDGTVLVGPVGGQIFNLVITPVNDTLTANFTPGTVTYVENAAPVALLPNLVLSDPDTASLSSVSVRIQTNHSVNDDFLSVTTAFELTANYTAATGILLISGPATVPQYQAVLSSLTYFNSSNNPSTPVRDILVSFFSSAGPEGTAITRVGVTPENDAPIVANSQAITVLQDRTVTLTAAFFNVTDIDTTTDNLTIKISSSPTFGQFELTTDAGFAISEFTLRQVELGEIIYRQLGELQIRDSFVFLIVDGGLSVTDNARDIDITLVSRPALNVNGISQTFTENSPAIAIVPDLLVTDLGGLEIDRARVAIRGGFNASQDILVFADQLNIVGNFDSVTGVLTLTGRATLLEYQVALRSITYANTSDSPSTATRTIELSIESSSAISSIVTQQLNVVSVNDIPVLTVGSNWNVNEGGNIILTNGLLRLADDDNSSTQLRFDIVIAPTVGRFERILTGAIVTSFTQLDVNNRAIRYVHSGNEFVTSDQFSFRYTDSVIPLSVNNNVTIAIALSDDRAVVTLGGTVSTFVEQAALISPFNTSTVIDPDTNNLLGARISISAATRDIYDYFSFTTQLGITGVFDPLTRTLTLEGAAPVADYQTAIRSIVYRNLGDDPGTSKVFEVAVSDIALGSYGAVATRSIGVTPVNDAPVLVGGGSRNLDEGSSFTLTTALLNVTDVDNLLSTLVFEVSKLPSNGSRIVFNDAPNTAISQFTLAQLTLGTVSYRHSGNEAPSDSFEIRARDSQTSSNAVTFSITINPIDDPTVISVSPTASYLEAAAPISLYPDFSITDADNGQLSSATIRAVGSWISGADRLQFTSVAGIVVTYNSVTGDLDLTGSADLSAYQHVLRSIRYDNTSSDPESGLRRFNLSVLRSTQVVGSLAQTVSVVAVNNAPTITLAPNKLLIVEDEVVQFSGTIGALVGDVDLRGNDLSVTITASRGQVSLLQNTGLRFLGNEDGAPTTSFTFSGSLFDLNAALATLQFHAPQNQSGSAYVDLLVRDNGEGGLGGPAGTLVRFNFTISAVNDTPDVVVNRGLVVNEADQGIIDFSRLSITDVEQDISDLVIRVNTSPTGGRLEFIDAVGVSILNNTFTMQDVIGGRLRYVHAGAQSNADFFEFSVSDGIDWSPSQRFEIAISGINDAPYFISIPSQPISILEDVNLSFSGANAIVIADPDAGASVVRVTLRTLNGHLTLGDTSGLLLRNSTGIRDSFLDIEGSIASINQAMLTMTFRGNTNFSGAASVEINVDDNGNNGSGGPLQVLQTISFNINPVDDVPILLSATPLSTIEGGRVALTLSNLSIQDVDTNIGNIVFVLSNGGEPTQGAIVNGAGVALSSFSYLQLLSGDVYYLHDGGNSTDDFFLVQARDATNTTQSVRFDVQITPQNDAPIVSDSNSLTLRIDEQEVSTPIFNNLIIRDDDSSVISGATVQILAGYQIGADQIIASTDPTSPISISWDSVNGTLRLVGNSSLSNYEAVLQSVRFVNHSDAPTAAVRSLMLRVFDSGGASANLVSTIAVDAVNDAPMIVRGSQVLQTNEDVSLTLTTVGRTAFRVVDPDLATALVNVSLRVENGRITLPNQGSLIVENGSFVNSTEVMFTGLQSEVNAAIDGLIFNATPDFSGTARIFLSVTDLPQVGAVSAVLTQEVIEIEVVAVEDKIIVINGNGAFESIEGGPSQLLIPLIELVNNDNAIFSSVTVSLVGINRGGDTLSVETSGGLVVNWNSATYVLTIGGSGTASDYQSVLRSLRYTNNSTSDINHTAAFDLAFTTNIGVTNHRIGSLDFVAINSAPTLVSNLNTNFIEGQSGVLPWLDATVRDLDTAALSSLVVRFTEGYQLGADQLSFTSVRGIATTWDETKGELRASGSASLSSYQNWLRSISYSNSSDLPSTAMRRFEISLNDGQGGITNRPFVISVASVNDAPSVSLVQSLLLPEDSRITLNDRQMLGLQIADPDAASTRMVLQIQVDQGTLINTGIDSSVVVTASALGQSIRLEGTIEILRASLGKIEFLAAKDQIAPARITVTLNDSFVSSGAITSTLTFLPVNDAPTAQISTAPLGWSIGAPGPGLAADLDLSDIDSTLMSGAKVSISQNFQFGDQLQLSNVIGLQTSWDSVLGVLTITGTASVEQYETLLKSATFTTSSTSLLERTISFSVVDSGSAKIDFSRALIVAAKQTDNTGTGTNSTSNTSVSPTAAKPPITDTSTVGTGSNTPLITTSPISVTVDAPSISNTSTSGSLTAGSVTTSSQTSNTTSSGANSSIGNGSSTGNDAARSGSAQRGAAGQLLNNTGVSTENISDELNSARRAGLNSNSNTSNLTFSSANLNASDTGFALRIKQADSSYGDGNSDFRSLRTDIRADRDASGVDGFKAQSGASGASNSTTNTSRYDEQLLLRTETDVVINVSKADELRVDVLSLPVQGGSVVMSAVVLWWITRAGGLLTALLATLPTWQNFDPLPILEATDGRDSDDESEQDEEDEVFAQ
jgi:large repetitive protein